MSEQATNDTGWWNVEPPDYDREPAADELPAGAGYYEFGSDLNADPSAKREYLDGRQVHPLFQDVRLIEENDGVRLEVPKRYIDTPADGKWAFEIRGKQRWFKEHDDFGAFRLTQSGVTLWIPHLFPFEETNEAGLPVILDRERCELTVSLQPIGENNTDVTTAQVETQFGTLTADEAPGSYNQYQILFFTDFEYQGVPLRADLVTYPDFRWSSLGQYLQEKDPTTSQAKYDAIMLGNLPLPEEYSAQDRPDDWSERQPSRYAGTASGTIWVPLDEIRRGIESTLSFPCFSE